MLTGYTLVFIKLTLGILALILQMNLMGKGNLAPNSALDQVQNYVLGGIIGAVIYSESIGILQFFLVLIAWTIVVMGLRFLSAHVGWIKTLIDGRPSIVIDRGQIRVGECLKRGLRGSDLQLKLRSAGVTLVSDVRRAVLEQNGQLTLVMNGDDLIRYPIIVDGVVDLDILDLADKDMAWLEEEVRDQGYSISDIYVGEYSKGHLILHPYEGRRG